MFGSTAASAVFVKPVPSILFNLPWSTSELFRQQDSRRRVIHGRNNGRLSIFRQDLSIKLAFAEFTFEAVDLMVR